MFVSTAITDAGFREYVKNQVPRLAGIKPIVRAMEKHGFVPEDRFREMVRHDSIPYILTATGANVTRQNPILPKQWWGFPTTSGAVINIDPETMASFDNPARLSSLPSRTGSKRKVYLAGLAILQGILVDGHQQANSLMHDFISASWIKFELEVYGQVIDGWETQSA